jgi:CubicO group peptidase (beta-lactamase class C family)
MKSTTFDFARAQKGNHARPHGLDIDGKIALGKMDLHYGIVAARPAGGVWTSAHQLSQYVMLELSDGKLPSGAQLVSTRNLLARRAPQIQLGEDSSYRMGLTVDHNYDVTVVHHGGDLRGYHSDMIWLPEHAVGAVILTNGDTGWLLPEPFARRLLEVLFDGRPEAVEDLAASARTLREQLAKWRQSLVVPADAALAAKLAPRYRNAALGDVEVKKRGPATVFDFGEWKSEVASRRNFDGSVSFITIEPTLDGYEFLVAEHALVVRDGQHEYVFKEIEPRASR